MIKLGKVKKGSISNLTYPVTKPVDRLSNTCSCSTITINPDSVFFKIKSPNFIPFQIEGDYTKTLTPVIHYKDGTTEVLKIEMIIIKD